MSRAHSLYRLQEIDLALDKNNARLEEIEEILQDSGELQKAYAALDQSVNILQETQSGLNSVKT